MSETNGKVKAKPLFDLAHAILAAVVKCRRDPDATPYAVVIQRDEYSHAKHLWETLACSPKSPNHGVQMDLTPDQRVSDLAVLLFSKRKAGD